MNKIWLKTVGDKSVFQKCSKEQIEGMTDEEFVAYKEAQEADVKAQMKDYVDQKSKEAEERMKELQTEMSAVKDEQMKALKAAMLKQSEVIKELKSKGVDRNSSAFESAMKIAWDESVEEFKELKGGQSAGFVFKASQTYGDINSGLDFAQFKPGITDIPVRKPVFKTMFATIPISQESLKYTEQNTVVRDAQNVAKCAEVTSTTKETLVVNNIDTKVVQDTIDFCRMFVSDFDFMSSRINKLLNESIALRSDQQVLLGTGAGEETFSINSVSSDFSAANVACVLTTSIQAPNLVDLISGMATQIFELGQQNAYVPNKSIVNNCDWFKDVASLKDQNNNYLDTRVIVQGGKTFIVTLMGLIEVVTSPLVPQNSCYVLDSTKGDIVDRMEIQVDVSFENKDNFVKHIGTLLGWERFNFLVETNNANAFMRCLDIDAAIIAITKP